ncbi:hypothetical protein FRX31_013405, partial [Thalictrum thalictroides]
KNASTSVLVEKSNRWSSSLDPVAEDDSRVLLCSHNFEEIMTRHMAGGSRSAARSDEPCFACLGNGGSVWCYAKACIMLKPNWPEAYYRARIALSLIEKYDMATVKLLTSLCYGDSSC